MLGSSSVAIKGPQFFYQNHEKSVKILLIPDNKINVSVLKMESDTLPGVKWNVGEILHADVVEILSQNPES